jgi:DNA-binding IclR family transcriptional regulator
MSPQISSTIIEIMVKYQSIQVISRAAAILRTLGDNTDGLSLGQIAKSVNLPRSTVQRIVSALALEGLVSTERGSGGIRLGAEIPALARAYMSDATERLRQAMRAISDQTGETVDLSILQGNKMVFRDQIVGTHRLRAVSSIGDSFPLTMTANGKSALACLDQSSAIRLILSEFDEMGQSELPVAGLLNELETVRQGGLATDEDEHTEGICALGFPIKEQNGDILALSVPVPSSRYARNKEELRSALLDWRAKFGT